MSLPPLIDTHAHLCSEEFRKDLSEVLERAQKAGVGGIIAVGETLKDAKRNLKLSRSHLLIHPSGGLYPTLLDIAQARNIHDFILEHRNRFVAIGEVGLDYWEIQSGEDREIQKEIFRSFIRLSKKVGLPLNVHSRSAGRHVIDILLEENAEKVQLHAFDGRASTALKGVEAGFFFSIPPSIVRSRQKQKLVRALPLDTLLVETDSPVLGPNPKERNEPANLQKAVQAIADIKQVSLGYLQEILFENTVRLYGNLILTRDSKQPT